MTTRRSNNGIKSFTRESSITRSNTRRKNQRASISRTNNRGSHSQPRPNHSSDNGNSNRSSDLSIPRLQRHNTISRDGGQIIKGSREWHEMKNRGLPRHEQKLPFDKKKYPIPPKEQKEQKNKNVKVWTKRKLIPDHKLGKDFQSKQQKGLERNMLHIKTQDHVDLSEPVQMNFVNQVREAFFPVIQDKAHQQHLARVKSKFPKQLFDIYMDELMKKRLKMVDTFRTQPNLLNQLPNDLKAGVNQFMGKNIAHLQKTKPWLVKKPKITVLKTY